jgi:hypothetical protein
MTNRSLRIVAACGLIALLGDRAALTAPAIDIGHEVATSLTLHEPVAITTTVTNGTDDRATIAMGRDYLGRLHLSLLRPDHRQVTAEPGQVSGPGGLFFQGDIVLGPGESKALHWVLNRWFEIEQIGNYELTIQSNASGNVRGRPVALEGMIARLRFTVTGRDPAKLQQRATSLLHIVNRSPDWSAVKEAAEELASIHDPIAVPYLSEAIGLRKQVDMICIAGLERIGTDAVAALRQETQNADPGTAAAARAALKRIGK